MNNYKEKTNQIKDKRQDEDRKSQELVPNSSQLELPFSVFQSDSTSENHSSNLLGIQDSFPIYSTTSTEMTALKKERGKYSYLPQVKTDFLLKTSSKNTEKLQITISPAVLYDKKTGEAEGFLPTANEQIIEQILRLFLIRKKDNSIHQSNDETMVFFTISDIRRELSELGKKRDHNQILHSLEVLRGTSIKVNYGESSFNDESILTAFGYHEKAGKYYARFCSTIHKSIRNINEYTQFDYHLTYAKKGKTQLASWIVIQMFLHFKNADITNHMLLSFEYVRDASLLLKSSDRYQQVRTLRNAFKQLINPNKEELEQEQNFREIGEIIGSKRKSNPQYTDYPVVRVEEIKQGNDIYFQIYPSDIFIDAMISSNKRKKNHSK